MTSTLIFALVLIAGLVLWGTRKHWLTPQSGDKRSLESLDTVTGWQPQSTRVLTQLELEAYTTLRSALPDYFILAQVPLARFISVPPRNSHSEWLRRVGVLCADLVICDTKSQVVAIIEIRVPEANEDGQARRKRHARMDRVLQSAGIPIHVWHEYGLPSAADARLSILGPLDSKIPALNSPTQQGKSERPSRPVGASATHSKVNATEPPPSDWVDNLESNQTPVDTSFKLTPRNPKPRR